MMATEKNHKILAPACADVAEKAVRDALPLTNPIVCDVTLTPSEAREVVFIPRPTVLTANMDIFTDMQTFCRLTGYIPLNTNIRVAGKLPNIVHRVRARGSMVQSFRRAFSFQSRYELLEERPANELFPYAAMQKWRRKKQTLLSKLTEHEDSVEKLMETRKECWRSECKVKKYGLITATQISALRHNPDDVIGRTKALHEMQKVLARKEKLHEKACDRFRKRLLADINLREAVHRISEELEGAVLDEIRTGIARLMKAYRQDVSEKTIGKLARTVYKKTCRKYEYDFVEFQLEPCQKRWIKEPEFVDSEINKRQMQKLMK